MNQRLATSLAAVSVLGLALCLPSPASAQITVELNGGAGVSVVNLEQWYGGYVSDWNKLTYQGNAQVHFANLGKLRIGAEAGYDYFFWYSVPSGYSWVYTYDAKAFHVSAVGRADLGGNLFADFGTGAYIFSGGYTKVGAMGALGYMLKVNEKISVPIKARVVVVVTDPLIIPIGVSAGVLVRL